MKSHLMELVQEAKISHFHTTAGSFSTLAQSTQRQRVGAIRSLFDVVFHLVAPEEPHALKEMVYAKQKGIRWEGRLYHKLELLLEHIAEAYAAASSASERNQILSLVAPYITLSKLTEYIPGLKRYRFSMARMHAKKYGPGKRIEQASKVRIRFDGAKVDYFISFILSPTIVIDLPFGTTTVKTHDGQIEVIPNVARIMVNERIVDHYTSYLKEIEQEDMTLSRSSLLRILHYCIAKTRRSLHGLDYYTFAGVEGIDTILDILKVLLGQSAIDKEWYKVQSRNLLDGKAYIKSEYKSHVKSASRIGDHCFQHSLSDPNDPDFHEQCADHGHDLLCPRCELMKQTVADIQNQISSEVEFQTDEEKVTAIWRTTHAIEDINNWKMHQIRSVYQERQKASIMEQLSEIDVFITLDWAMKFLPTRGREDQSSWYGKHGISWHIMVALWNGTSTFSGETGIHQRTYVHVLDQSAQGSDDVTALLEHGLMTIVQEIPKTYNIIIRSDNAACYHSSTTMASIQSISERVGMQIKRWSFSEPQAGKGPCDRAAGVIKRHVYLYVDEGHSVENAKQFADAVASHNGVKGVSTFEGTINTPKPTIQRGKKTNPPSIPGISKYYDFHFEPNRMKVWRFHDIGSGKYISPKFWLNKQNKATFVVERALHEGSETSHYFHLWKPLGQGKKTPDASIAGRGLSEVITHTGQYTSIIAAVSQHYTDQPEETTVEDEDAIPAPEDGSTGMNIETTSLHFCPEDGCTKSFVKYGNLMRHLEVGKHTYSPERETLLDRALGMYKSGLEKLQVTPEVPEIRDAINELGIELGHCTKPIHKGWAIKADRKQCKIFNENIRTYLTEKFDEGIQGRRKWDPQELQLRMFQVKFFYSFCVFHTETHFDKHTYL